MKKLCLDLEVAPNIALTWGLFQQNVSLDQIVESGYTLCWAAQWYAEKEIMYMSLRDGERKMLETIHGLLEEADAVIHHNGKHFDIPILNKDFIKHNITPPSPYHQIDLLETARRRFKFTSNKLDYVAQFLGVGSKLHHKGMALWVGCMNNDPLSWKRMERYNKQDVRLLPKVYAKLLPWINNHPNEALYSDEEVPMCNNCQSKNIVKNGIEHLNTQSYQRYRCQDCGTPMRGRSTILLKEKRRVVLVQSKL